MSEEKDNFVYEPTERQSYFHACSDDYIVVSGGRGSGVPAPAQLLGGGLEYNKKEKASVA